jgi:hypothetical protein
MEGRSFLRRKDREALRERWLKHCGAAFEEMFGEANQDQLVTFTQREDMACLLGEKLTAFLLQDHVAADSQVRPSEKQPPCCPKCQQPGRRVSQRRDELPPRELTTRAGDVTLRREQWQCTKCRILFFSVRPEAAFGDGGLQSAAAGKGGASGGQGGVLQGGQ